MQECSIATMRVMMFPSRRQLIAPLVISIVSLVLLSAHAATPSAEKTVEVQTPNAKSGTKGKKLTLNVGPVTATGFCNKADVTKVVLGSLKVFRKCTLNGPMTSAKVTLGIRWAIGIKGLPVGVGASKVRGWGATLACLKRAVRAMTFAKPEGGICLVKAPFVLEKK